MRNFPESKGFLTPSHGQHRIQRRGQPVVVKRVVRGASPFAVAVETVRPKLTAGDHFRIATFAEEHLVPLSLSVSSTSPRRQRSNLLSALTMVLTNWAIALEIGRDVGRSKGVEKLLWIGGRRLVNCKRATASDQGRFISSGEEWARGFGLPTSALFHPRNKGCPSMLTMAMALRLPMAPVTVL